MTFVAQSMSSFFLGGGRWGRGGLVTLFLSRFCHEHNSTEGVAAVVEGGVDFVAAGLEDAVDL